MALSLKSLSMGIVAVRVGLLTSVLMGFGSIAVVAQTCTTQAKMSPSVRDGLSGAVMNLAQEIKSNNAAKVQGDTIAEFGSASAFAPTAALVASTSAKVAADALVVTQIYILDARNIAPGGNSEADFSCALAGTTSETDFSISGLPPGLYAFAMVEANGDAPWMLSFLLRQDDGVWKLAGFYPKDRLAAGHDGVWYWNAARGFVKAKQPWIAWVYYGLADELLRPASFATSTNLDRMRAEQTAAAPPELINGIGPDMPLVMKSTDGKNEYRFTSIVAGNSESGKQLRLTLHMNADYMADVQAAKARNIAAATTLFDAHKDLREGAFGDVWIFADSTGYAPALTVEPMASIP
ncbi:MAG: hypothetical protein HIU91_00580 [Acidobacteria bacterium]|nr:hypothetical protein [Acidobacteriota bacterium]